MAARTEQQQKTLSNASNGAVVDALRRLETSMCEPKEFDERRAVFSLSLVSRILLQPLPGAGPNVLESAARLSVRACGVVRGPLDGALATRLLGGTALRLREGCEEARGGLLETSRFVFEKCDADAWRMLDDAKRGRPIVAAVLKAAVDLATDENDSRANRAEAFGLVWTAAQATPDHLKGNLWRCFLPGLFSPCYAVAAKVSWAPRDGGLRSDALDAASALVSAALSPSSKENVEEGGVAVARSDEWIEQTRQRLSAYLPTMLARCRRDPSERTRLSAARAASRIHATKFFEDNSGFLADTLAALRFDDESEEVARVATVALRDVDFAASLQEARSSAARVSAAARSGDERALIDALNTMRFASFPDSIDASLEALSVAFEVEGSARTKAIEQPLNPPTYLDTSEQAKTRAVRAARLGAAFHRPTFRWLRLGRSRDAARRACWLLAISQNKTLVVDRQLSRLDKASDAIVLVEILEAVAGEAFVFHQDEVQEVDEDDSTTTELVSVADFVARRALEVLRTTARDAAVDFDDNVGEFDAERASYSRDGSLVLSSETTLLPRRQQKLLDSTSGEDELAPALCRILALSCELAVVGGGLRGARRSLRQVLYPLLERLADPDATTRQAALGSLVTIAGFEEDSEQGEKDALAELLSKNMDYVVEAACRKMRRAKTAAEAARAAAVVEALLRHSRCSLATPLLRDVVENALRDIDEHRLDGADHSYAFARLMRAMLSTLPEILPSSREDDDDDGGGRRSARPSESEDDDWLRVCVDAMEPNIDPQDRLVAAAMSTMSDEDMAAMLRPATESKGEAETSANETLSERIYRKGLAEKKRLKEANTKGQTPEEDLVKRVLNRAIYFVSPKFDFQTRRVALEIVTDGVLRLRENEKQVRPLVHKVWPAVNARLRISSPDDLDDSDFANCLAASLDVVAAFVHAVGDFMAYKFNDDLWPALRVVLSCKITSKKHADRVPRAPRRRAFQAALACLRVFSDHPDCASFVRPVAAHAAKLALDQVRSSALVVLEEKDNFYVPPALPGLLKSLATHDPDSLWLLVSTELANMRDPNLSTIIETAGLASSWPTKPPLPCLPKWPVNSPPKKQREDASVDALLAPLLVDAYKYLDKAHLGRFGRVTLW